VVLAVRPARARVWKRARGVDQRREDRVAGAKIV